MQQLARAARGDYLMFTDADTVHGPESIAWAVTNLEWHSADCVSGYVFQEMSTLGEQFIVPATYIMSAMVLPLWLIAALPSPDLSFAIGQLIMFRREAFEAIGGIRRVRGEISDDLAIARELKKAGFREVFLDMRRYVRCRMYEGYRASFDGLSKNIYDIARHRSAALRRRRDAPRGFRRAPPRAAAHPDPDRRPRGPAHGSGGPAVPRGLGARPVRQGPAVVGPAAVSRALRAPPVHGVVVHGPGQEPDRAWCGRDGP